MNDKNLKEQLADTLAALVDGVPGADAEADALLRKLDDSDDALTMTERDLIRDQIHEAKEVSAKVKDAGADFVLPHDFKARVLKEIGAQRAADEIAQKVDASESIRSGEMKMSNQENGERNSVRTGPLDADELKSNIIAFAKNKWTWVAAAAACLLFAMSQFMGDSSAPDFDSAGAVAKIDAILGAESVEVDGKSRKVGDAIEGNATLTVGHARVKLTLKDGSLLKANAGTEIAFGKSARELKLLKGELLADVEHLDDGPKALYATPLGMVKVIGTKFLLSANDDFSSVRVTRGEVRLGDREVSVRAGQEGVIESSAQEAVSVEPVASFAAALRWAEFDSAEELPVPGLGELRAKKPGEKEDKERPLSIAEHKVKIRVRGHVARTEIEETFRNDDDDTLEGIYRFPLPPGARIASLSLEVDGKWEDGAFVDKSRAKKIWAGVIRNATPVAKRKKKEEFIWVPGPWRDPALLEWQQGGRVSYASFRYRPRACAE